MTTINAAALELLIAKTADDHDIVGLIEDAIAAFGNYHSKVIAHQSALMIYRNCIHDKVMAADQDRTISHNTVLSKIDQLNRLAAEYGLSAIYEGTVSRDQPYRREAADAVFAYLQMLIEHRI